MHKPFPACEACITKPVEFDEEECIRFPIQLPCSDCASQFGLLAPNKPRIPIALI